ncbi:MAG: hypothetical protein JWP89_3540 [Schlesneria sp.]|nr:hypothetical protein [Schlesneria sp.]
MKRNNLPDAPKLKDPRLATKSNYVLIASMLLGAFLTVSGALFLFAPHAGTAVFGMSVGDTASLRVVGVRQLAFGLVIALLALRGDTHSLAMVLFIGALVPAVDGLVVWQGVDLATSLRHFVAVPVSLGLGASLWRGRSA